MLEIETVGLTKKFGDFAAVRGLNLGVPKGSIFGFLGPNGSGKSTTVKMLTGLLRPTAGDALVG
jgi:ABC-2 type transport system ATP-binding protein